MLEAGCGRYLEKMQFPIGVYNSSFRPPKHEIESFARCIFPAIQAGRFGHHSIDVAMLGLDKKLGRADYKSDHVIHPVGYF
ncbi:MAG: hypothetical protein FWC27_06930 [Firmicutes bacterium]|nr:hypothetical protein [Bacillota bacterium]